MIDYFVRDLNKISLAFYKGGYVWNNLIGIPTNNYDVECIITRPYVEIQTIVFNEYINPLLKHLRNTDKNTHYTLKCSPNLSINDGHVKQQKPYHNEFDRGINSYVWMIDYKYVPKSRKETIKTGNFIYLVFYEYHQHFNLELFKQMYLQDIFLNKTGLFLYEHWANSHNHVQKQQWFFENVLKTTSDFVRIMNSYTSIFFHTPDFKMRDTYLMYTSYIKRFSPNVIKTVERILIENSREIWNGVIYRINELLVKNEIIGACFIVGGDAMKRYINEESIDIDTKCFYKYKKHRSIVHKIVVRACVEAMSKIVPISLNPIGGWNNLQLRYIQKHNEWPLDLFTIDMLYRIYINDFFFVPQTFAAFDISIQHNSNVNTSMFVRPQNSYFAHASKSFLIDDIKKTYDDPNLKQLRTNSGKNKKNMNRFTKLTQSNDLFKNYDDFEVASYDITQQALEYIQNIYSSIFRKDDELKSLSEPKMIFEWNSKRKHERVENSEHPKKIKPSTYISYIKPQLIPKNRIS